MAKKKKRIVEFRFYEVPQGEAALILYGEPWIRTYGKENDNLHFHNLMEIGICRDGKGYMILDDKKLDYHDGCVTIIPENLPHITVSEGDKENFWEYLFFDLNKLVGMVFPDNPVYQKQVIDVLNQSYFFEHISEKCVLTDIIDAIIKEKTYDSEYSTKMIHYLMAALITEIVRNNKGIPSEKDTKSRGSNLEQISKALDYISENYEGKIMASDLADVCGMSETHFRRVFEEYIQMSPLDYVNLVRIQKACDFLRKTNDPMDIIAEKCGFSTTSTFNRNFKKFLEITPYQWKINPGNYENKLLNYRISALKGW